MIITVTLNPAVDKTIKINDFKLGEVNRIDSVRLDAGGKGINVSKVIKVLNGKSISTGFLGGNSGAFIKDYLDSKGIENDFVFIKGETRTNIKLIDVNNNIQTDINENGTIVEDKFLKILNKKIIDLVDNNSVIVLSGSIPTNIDKSIYRYLIEETKKRGGKTILDADGELLKEGIKAAPYIVKPNIYELQKAYSISLNNLKDIIRISKEIINNGVKYVVVSLGEEGSLFVSEDKIARVRGLAVDVKSTVGAGDSMVASLAVAIDRNYDFETAITLSAAASTACVMTEGTQSGKLDEIEKLISKIEIEYI